MKKNTVYKTITVILVYYLFQISRFYHFEDCCVEILWSILMMPGANWQGTVSSLPHKESLFILIPWRKTM